MNSVSDHTEQTNPFPGLRPFREDEEYLFFGRENQVDTMVDKLAATRFLAVVGTSGSGKSSLVNCGLRPALHGGLMASAGTAWRMAQFRPGSDPLGAMVRALAKDGVLFHDYRAGGLTLGEVIDTTLRMSKLGIIDIYEQAKLDKNVNLLLVVDQFEELFRYRQLGNNQQENAYDISEEATAFVNLLLEATKAQTTCPIYVVLTMRSDFLGDCTQFSGLAEAINEGQYLVPRMTRDERRAAISGPVGVGGAEIAPVLLTRLVNDVGDNPDQLSILQHALNRTWARWQYGNGSGPLDLKHYEDIGAMAHALDQHAEKAYAELNTARQQQICEKLFKALTDKATDPRGVRRPTKLGTLCALADATTEEVTAVINVFRQPSRSFLMPPAGEVLEEKTVIDISHESLMRVWKKLDEWAKEEAQSAQLYRRLADAAARDAVDNASLWRDPELQQAINWRDLRQPNETWASRYHPGYAEAMCFLTKSIEAREVEQAKQEEEVERQRKFEQAQVLATEQQKRIEEQTQANVQLNQQKRKAMWSGICAAGLAVLAVGAAWWAIDERDGAKEAARWAIEEGDKAKEAQKESFSRELATASVLNLETNPERSLLLALHAADEIMTPEAEDVLHRAILASRGKLTLAGHTELFDAVDVSPDGARLATADYENDKEKAIVKIWNVTSGEEPITLNEYPGKVTKVAFNPDGTRLAIVAYDSVEIWDATSGERLLTLDEYSGKVTSVAFSPRGTRLATSNYDKDQKKNIVTVWDTTLDENLHTMVGHIKRKITSKKKITSIAFSRDKTRLATTSQNTIKVWNVATGEELLALEGHAQEITSVTFSRDSTRLASSSFDQTAKIWDATSGDKLLTLVGHTKKVTALAFSPDVTRLATSSDDYTTKVWDTDSGEELLALVGGHTNEVTSVTFSPDGTRLFTGSVNGALRMWELGPARELPSLTHLSADNSGKSLTSVTFSPDGTQLAASSDDNTIKVWNAASSQELLTLVDHTKGVNDVAFSPDGTRLATGSQDDTAKIWDAMSGQELLTLVGHTEDVNAVAFSPDGTRLATGSQDDTAKIWDATSGEELLTLEGHNKKVNAVAFSPDGTLLATSSNDSTAKVWDASLGKALSTLSHDRSVTAVAFSPDGTRLATTSRHAAKVWDATTSDELFTLEGHTNLVTDVVFSPDSKRLYTSSYDKTVKVWDTETRRNLLTLHGHTAGIAQFALRRDGTQLATVSKDQTVRRFILDPDQLKALARKRVTRSPKSLTLDECLLFPHIERCIALGFVRRGQNQAEAGDVHAARASFQEAKTLATDTILDTEVRVKKLAPKGLIRKGKKQAQAGDVKGARASFQEAKMLDPDSISDPEAKATKLAAEGLIRKGKKQAHAGDVKGARASFQEANTLAPDSISDPEAQVKRYAPRALIRKGERQAQAGDVKGARASFQEANTLAPNSISDPEAEATKLAAQGLITKGQRQAQAGGVKGARASFQEAKMLVPDSISDPEAEATKFAVKGLVNEGIRQIRIGDINGARASFQEANTLAPDFISDPEAEVTKYTVQSMVEKGKQLASQGKVEEAIIAFQEARELDDTQVSARAWNSLCWRGSLKGYAADVMYACEQAVEKAPKNENEFGGYSDSRGVARVLLGNFPKAIDDFQNYIDYAKRSESLKDDRREWIKQLEKGQNPLDYPTLKKLYKQ